MMVFEGNCSMNRHNYYNCSDSFGKFQFVKIRTFVLQLHKLDFGRRSHFHPSHNLRGLPMAMKDSRIGIITQNSNGLLGVKIKS